MARHGRMVDLVCRHTLGNPDDAQDAFQATFLILARRAGSIRRAEALGGWLHRIAVRVATRARSAAARRGFHERRGGATRALASRGGSSCPESWPELHEEIARLPAHYREPVVLCYLEGFSVEAAAGQLGCPRGTVLSRLARARERLKGRLARRGITPADLPVLPVHFTTPSATRVALGLAPASAGAGILMKGVLVTMSLERWSRVGLLLLACGSSASLLAVAVAVEGRTAAQDHPPNPPVAELPPPRGLPSRAETKRDAPLGPLVTNLAFAPDGRGIAARAQDGRVMILDPTSGEERVALQGQTNLALQGQTNSAWAIAYSPDGTLLACAGDRNLVTLWDPATGAWQRSIAMFRTMMVKPAALAFAPDGTTLAIIGHFEHLNNPRGNNIGFEIVVIDVASGDLVWSHDGRDSLATAVVFSPDGRTVATAGKLAVRLWDARTGEPGDLLRCEQANPLRLAFAPDSKTLAAVGYYLNVNANRLLNGQVTVWDLATGTRLRTLEAPNEAAAVAFAPDGKSIAAGGIGPTRQYTRVGGGEGAMQVSETRLWDVATGERLWSSEGDLGRVRSLAFAPDGRSLVRCDEETVALIDAKTGKVIRILRTVPRRL